MRPPLPATRGDAFELAEFLRSVDLTVSGIGEPELHAWVDLDVDGRIVGCTGFELEGDQALLRSVAVHPALRHSGRGTELARFAIRKAVESGATRAWLFSRRSGPFWENMGFGPSDVDELANALPTSHQVRAFTESGQLRYESAWSRSLP
jgi:N-acetylglutamate synthase-like GNAT family acetyltransferase